MLTREVITGNVTPQQVREFANYLMRNLLGADDFSVSPVNGGYRIFLGSTTLLSVISTPMGSNVTVTVTCNDKDPRVNTTRFYGTDIFASLEVMLEHNETLVKTVEFMFENGLTSEELAIVLDGFQREFFQGVLPFGRRVNGTILSGGRISFAGAVSAREDTGSSKETDMITAIVIPDNGQYVLRLSCNPNPHFDFGSMMPGQLETRLQVILNQALPLTKATLIESAQQPTAIPQAAPDALNEPIEKFRLTAVGFLDDHAFSSFTDSFARKFNLTGKDVFTYKSNPPSGPACEFKNISNWFGAVSILKRSSEETLISVCLTATGHSRLPPELNSRAVVQKELQAILDSVQWMRGMMNREFALQAAPASAKVPHQTVAGAASGSQQAVQPIPTKAYEAVSAPAKPPAVSPPVASPPAATQPAQIYSFVYTDPENPIHGVTAKQLDAFLDSTALLFPKLLFPETSTKRGKCSFGSVQCILISVGWELASAKTNDAAGSITVTIALHLIPEVNDGRKTREEIRDLLIDKLDAALAVKEPQKNIPAGLRENEAKPDTSWQKPPGRSDVIPNPSLENKRGKTFRLGSDANVVQVWRPVRRH